MTEIRFGNVIFISRRFNLIISSGDEGVSSCALSCISNSSFACYFGDHRIGGANVYITSLKLSLLVNDINSRLYKSDLSRENF